VVHAKAAGGEPGLPRWTSDRQALTAELAGALAAFRTEAARRLADGPGALRAWLCDGYELDPEAAAVLVALFEAQERLSEVPGPGALLVEESPHDGGLTYPFHAPLSRSACEALGRATAARLGRRFGRDLTLAAADLGWSVRLPEGARLGPADIPPLLDPADFAADVLEGLDRGDLPARRFRHVAGTALMVLRNPDGGRRRGGGARRGRTSPGGSRPPAPAARCGASPGAGCWRSCSTPPPPSAGCRAGRPCGSGCSTGRPGSPRPGSGRGRASRCGSSRPPRR